MIHYLPETAGAIDDYAVTRLRRGGSHQTSKISARANGRRLSARPFDPTRDVLSSAVPFSLEARATGNTELPYVQRRANEDSLVIDIVLHESANNSMPAIARTKRRLARELALATDDAVKHDHDRVRGWYIGDPNLAPQDFEPIATGKDPLAAAEAAAQVCNGGLALVISDFKRLPLEQVEMSTKTDVLGVFVAHPVELAITPKSGTWYVGDENIDSGNSRQLTRYKARQAEYFESRVSTLRNAGVFVMGLTVDLDAGAEVGKWSHFDIKMANAISTLGEQ